MGYHDGSECTNHPDSGADVVDLNVCVRCFSTVIFRTNVYQTQKYRDIIECSFCGSHLPGFESISLCVDKCADNNQPPENRPRYQRASICTDCYMSVTDKYCVDSQGNIVKKDVCEICGRGRSMAEPVPEEEDDEEVICLPCLKFAVKERPVK